jgi:hypothetical protein
MLDDGDAAFEEEDAASSAPADDDDGDEEEEDLRAASTCLEEEDETCACNSGWKPKAPEGPLQARIAKTVSKDAVIVLGDLFIVAHSKRRTTNSASRLHRNVSIRTGDENRNTLLSLKDPWVARNLGLRSSFVTQCDARYRR